MTDRYTFAPLLVDASPIPSRFAAPLDSGAGGVWLEPWPEGCRHCQDSTDDGRCDSCGKRLSRIVLSLPIHDIDLVFRRRGQRPAGIPRSAWWRLSRRERRQIGGAP